MGINLVTESYTTITKFGAKGDGRTDDSGAIQRAIDYCEINSIKTLYIPNGDYYIKKPVVFRKGGVQLVGTGALLREESWWQPNNIFPNNQPFSGCSFIIENNIEGFVFSKTVVDPVRISDIQFIAKNGRKRGRTTAIALKSEFRGPTWPFIIERCHFRGFNFAVKFQSPNQYCVAYIQIKDCAFSQNDECIYFSDITSQKSYVVGTRNLSWGFTFTNNKCHDNSRVIRGAFAKDAVNIKDNNMEGNIVYANGLTPENIIDIELSHAILNFEGNHFETIISDAVCISSVFKKPDGSYFPTSGTTAYDEKNKVFLKGNNFDGVNLSLYKPYNLTGLVVYNYDPYNMYINACDIRENHSNYLNVFLDDFAKRNGTNFKLPAGKYENSYMTIPNYAQKKSVIIKGNNNPQVILSPISNLPFIKVDKSTEQFFNTYSETLTAPNNTDFIGASFIVNNQTGTGFLGASVTFYVNYTVNGRSTNQVLYTHGNYGADVGFTTITALLPTSILPRNSRNIKFRTALSVDDNILAGKSLYLANRFTLFTFSGDNPYAIPVFQ